MAEYGYVEKPLLDKWEDLNIKTEYQKEWDSFKINVLDKI